MHLISGKAKAAQIYPVKICEAIIKGLRMWMHQSEDGQRRHILEFTRNDLREPMEAQSIEGGGFDLDDLKGDHLDQALVKIARAEEIQVFKEWKVYEPVPRSSMLPGKRVIGVYG